MRKKGLPKVSFLAQFGQKNNSKPNDIENADTAATDNQLTVTEELSNEEEVGFGQQDKKDTKHSLEPIDLSLTNSL